MSTTHYEELERRIAALEAHAMSRTAVKEMIRESILVPSLERPTMLESDPFMAYTNVSSLDFTHPRYAQLCKLIYQTPTWHRKQWEYIYILHQLLEANILRPGTRGIGFGVDAEPLPSAFAQLGSAVLATDAPAAIKMAGGWLANHDNYRPLDRLHFGWIPESLFRERVNFTECNMKDIDSSFSGYDFAWSSCCLEHLGTLEAGLDFVMNSVEKCLRIGGIAVHTTELNLSSDVDTVEASDETVLYRRRDLEAFVERMRERGHDVQPIRVGPAATALDFHVEVPPYSPNPHLRLKLAGFVTTSAGLVIRRGR